MIGRPSARGGIRVAGDRIGAAWSIQARGARAKPLATTTSGRPLQRYDWTMGVKFHADHERRVPGCGLRLSTRDRQHWRGHDRVSGRVTPGVARHIIKLFVARQQRVSTRPIILSGSRLML